MFMVVQAMDSYLMLFPSEAASVRLRPWQPKQRVVLNADQSLLNVLLRIYALSMETPVRCVDARSCIGFVRCFVMTKPCRGHALLSAILI